MLPNKVSALTFEVSRLNSTVSKIARELEQVQTQIAEYKSQITNLESERNELKIELTNAQKIISQYEARTSSAQWQEISGITGIEVDYYSHRTVQSEADVEAVFNGIYCIASKTIWIFSDMATLGDLKTQSLTVCTMELNTGR